MDSIKSNEFTILLLVLYVYNISYTILELKLTFQIFYLYHDQYLIYLQNVS